MSESTPYDDDRDMIAALKAGDNKAYRLIYQRYYKMAYSFVTNNNGKPTDAEDLFQEVLIALVNNIRKKDFQLRSKLSTYLYSIIRQSWLYKLRSKKSSPQIKDIETDFVDISDDEIGKKKILEKRDDLTQLVLKEIGEDCRRIIVDYYYKKLKLKDIGKAMEYTDSFIKVKKNRCMKSLTNKIKEHPDYKTFKI